MTTDYLYEFRIRRVRRSKCAEPSPMTSPATAAAIFRRFTDGEAREIFLAASLDNRNHLLGVEQVAVGSLAGVDVHPREVFRAAILAGAAAIVIAHNHPSGDTEPSAQDLDLTRRLRGAGELLGIPVLDHIIVTEHSYLSIAERYPGAL